MKTMTILALAAGLVLTGSASAHDGDATLAAINAAKLNGCPAGRAQANARTEAFGDFKGVTIAELATVPQKGEPPRRVHLVRVTVAPGGVIGWHEHSGDQGMAILVSGTATELRNDCRDPIEHKAGDILLENENTAHGFRNSGKVPAVFLVAGGLPRE
ncbi:MAG: cupin domain-containing protein [Novosphingobium sp.]